MKGPSPFSADQYAPLLCLWGIKSLKRKGDFCIKIQTMVHKTFFFLSLSCFMLYTFSFALPLQLSSPGRRRGGGAELFNEAGNFDFRRSRRLQGGKQPKLTIISLGVHLDSTWRLEEYVVPVAHM